MLATIPSNASQNQDLTSLQFQLTPLEIRKLLNVLEETEQFELLRLLQKQAEAQDVTQTFYMPKSYQDFSLRDVEVQFGIQVKRTSLFTNTPPIVVDELLSKVLDMNKLIPLKSEKARSESMVFPVLVHLVARHKAAFTLFSGEKFEVDKTKGLTGYCDYLLCNQSSTYLVTAPVFTIVEAKKADVEEALGQCAAAMVAAQQFNAQHKTEFPTLYGVVTSGKEWQRMAIPPIKGQGAFD